MQFASRLVAFLVLASTEVAFAGGPPPFPPLCTIAVVPSPAGCQHRFRADGLLDDLSVTVTLLDAGGVPVPGLLTFAQVTPDPDNLFYCQCGGWAGLGMPTDAAGKVTFTWFDPKIGGYGNLSVLIVVVGGLIIGSVDVPFTTPDLNGSCEDAPGSAVNIIDLAIFAGGLPPGYTVYSDYNCSGAPINVVDLGVWAGGINKGCP